jgi:glycosyltransferase involved in cell wall biosynthesis
MTDSGPTVTVVINTYNDRAHVARAVTSVLAQTRSPDEIFVIDDGSSDGTDKSLKDTFGDQLRYHYHENRGLPASRNVAFDLSSGDWLAFLDSDDTWAADKLELSLAAIHNKPEAGMVACVGVEVSPEGRVLNRLGLPEPFSMEAVRLELLRRNPFSPSGVMIRRDVLREVGGWPEDMRYAEDIVTFANIAASFEIVPVQKVLFYKTVLPTSMQFDAEKVLRYGPRSFQLCKRALARRTWPGRWVDEVAFRQGVTQIFLHTAWVYSGRRQKGMAAKCILRGLMRWPFLTARQLRSVYWLCARLLLNAA